MPYRSLADAVTDLERNRMLLRIPDEVDGHLEVAEIQRRAYAAGAPAILYERVKGSAFPCVSNLFGTMERARFLLRHGLDGAKAAVRYRAEPSQVFSDLRTRPSAPLSAAAAAIHSLPRRIGAAPSQAHRISLSNVPRITSWPDDGGPFITLPQVFTEDPDVPPGGGPFGAPLSSNVGMYRIQLAGGEYGDGEAGMHYQIHRGIGVHHTAAERREEPLRVSIFVGGPPAHTLAAVMPLPEGLSELLFAGMLAGRRFSWRRRDDGFVVSADADFTITGWVDPGRTLPEGPFGDHLGYYSLTHPFPVLRVTSVTHREGAIWPFTVVGRPPQEDTTFGRLIHEITEPMVPTTLPGVHSVHAVDAAGVHPLLLAVGSERYSPFTGRRPQELWTIANAILGFGQCSLAKYLFIAAREDAPELAAHDIRGDARPRPPPGGSRLRPPLPDPHHDRHSRLLRKRPERRLQAGHRRSPDPREDHSPERLPTGWARRFPRGFTVFRPCCRASSSSGGPASNPTTGWKPISRRCGMRLTPRNARAPTSPECRLSSSATTRTSPRRASAASSGSPSPGRTRRTTSTAGERVSATSIGVASNRC